MKQHVLLIDNEVQSEVLSNSLAKSLPDTTFVPAHREDNIIYSIENLYFSIIYVNLQVNHLSMSGIALVDKIIEANPLASIILSGSISQDEIETLFDEEKYVKIIGLVQQKDSETFIKKLKKIIRNYHKRQNENPAELNNVLLELYSQAKNESDSFVKGKKFELFVSLLFQFIGFPKIYTRVKDISLNEIDLIIRNEIEDAFLSKFGKYFLVECKNMPKEKIDKNTFIVFNNKLAHTNQLSELGILATTGYFSRSTLLEASRNTQGPNKVIFLSNLEFKSLIQSKYKLDTFKEIIDQQVKNT